ncbi:ATP-binding cassette domain-containing protein [Pseudonocardia sp. CA-107938]|uniref:ATP-binding cassette domain-containing protein n=1 Tax=Pseudonocardia sp. CA-107938 TaxID=3240021 RepID=UPI003D8D2D56
MSPLLEVKNLVKEYPVKRNLIGRVSESRRAVEDVSFTLDEGRTLAVVGESGAGKSSVARMVLRLIDPTAGEIWFKGTEIAGLSRSRFQQYRRDIQMVFQDPYSSLQPLMTVGDSVAEPLLLHTDLDRAARRKKAEELLEQVGLSRRLAGRRPHELSGGMLQRVSIARALSVEPSLVVCDEPVAALDVSIRAQVINLLMDIQAERGLSYLFISHDLHLVRHIADDVVIMKQGRVKEYGECERVFTAPEDPYAKELLGASLKPVTVDAAPAI